MIKKKNFVEFLSPGTLFSEITEKPIESWDPVAAAKMAKKIKERHGATPYGFRFEERIVADPIDDGEGGKLAVEQKTTRTSGTYFLTGKVETYDDVVKRDDPRDSVLRSNMRCNDYALVVSNCNSYRSTHPFHEKDFVVDAEGHLVELGDAPHWVAYRKQMKKRWKKEHEAEMEQWKREAES